MRKQMFVNKKDDFLTEHGDQSIKQTVRVTVGVMTVTDDYKRINALRMRS